MVRRENYLQVKSFFDYLTGSQQLSPETVSRYWFCGRHLLLWAAERPLGEAHLIRPTFTAYLGSLVNERRKRSLSPATTRKITQISRRILNWLKSSLPSEYAVLPAGWVESLQPPRHVEASREPCYVSLEEVLALGSVPVAPGDLALRRDRAASALLFLSGMRASALCTMPISCLDIESRTVRQYPEMGVRTKNSKSATTYLLAIPELLALVRDWDVVVRGKLHATTAWYTPVTSAWGQQELSTRAPGANRNGALEKRLRRLFARAGLAYKSPHKFRHGHAVYGLLHAKSMADYKAVSMNLMHDDISVTDGIYAALSGDEVRKRISQLVPTEAGSDQEKRDLDGGLPDLDARSMAKILTAIANKLSQ
jgi:site-specific recombinase XerC